MGVYSMETHEMVPKRGPSSPKIIVDTVQNSSAIRPKPNGKSITHLDSNSKVQVIENRSLSKSPQVLDYAIKAKVPSNKNNLDDSNLVPERDVSTTSNNNETASQDQSNSTPGQLVSNVVVGEDSGFQILSSKD